MISAIVPTVGGAGGAARLERNLGSVFAALGDVGEDSEIIVIDDGGGGVPNLDPAAQLLSLPQNRGYGPAVNAGARSARGEYLLVLNDDVRLEPNTVARLRRHFPDPQLFAVVPSIRSPFAACGDEAGKAATWEAGMLEIREREDERASPVLYAVGCCFLCPTAAFLELGGYDDLFAPFLWEDVDLGYRAWRRGLTLLHDPASVCHHEGSATLGERHSLETRERLSFRNRVLFHLKNVGDPGLRAELYGALCAHALFEAVAARREGLAEALARREELRSPEGGGLEDREILARVALP